MARHHGPLPGTALSRTLPEPPDRRSREGKLRQALPSSPATALTRAAALTPDVDRELRRRPGPPTTTENSGGGPDP
ncbi:MAG: hypothetical protein LBT40_12415 [Deltaproteobacteria bacterium]|nr:hypothetical protein [Deltaproteobacteria bacterium]